MERIEAVEAHLWAQYPPKGDEWVRPAIDAVEAVEAGDYMEMVDLPDGLSLAAHAVVRDLKLTRFVEDFESLDFEDVDIEGEDE